MRTDSSGQRDPRRVRRLKGQRESSRAYRNSLRRGGTLLPARVSALGENCYPRTMTITAGKLASGAGWCVSDVVCTAGPADPAFEERHGSMCIALVTGGTFEYRSAQGAGLMSPGSLLL